MLQTLYSWAKAITIIKEQLENTITGSAEIAITNLMAIRDKMFIARNYFASQLGEIAVVVIMLIAKITSTGIMGGKVMARMLIS